MVADVRRVVASGAVSLQGGNAASDQAPGGNVVVDARHTTDGNLQSVEELLPASDGKSRGGSCIVIVVFNLGPFVIEVENVGSEPAVAGSCEPTGLFEGGEQKMNAGVDGDEKGLSGERHRSTVDTIVAEFAGEAVPGLRGEKFRFEIYDLLLLFCGWPGSVALRVNDGSVDGLVRQVGHE